jgi:IclR family transcriptional regulator, acetate operon repressor
VDGIQAAERALTLVDMLAAAAPEPIRVGVAAQRLEVTPASASRLLATLASRGYAARTADRRYTVGPRSFPLATAWIGHLRRAVGPSIARLAASTGDAIGMAQLLGETVMPVEVYVPKRHPVGVAPVDSWPMETTAMGHSLIATLPDEQRDRVSGGRLDRSSARHAGRGGLFTEHGETLETMSCFAVPIATGRGPVITLAVMCDRNRRGRSHEDRVRRELRAEIDRLGSLSTG